MENKINPEIPSDVKILPSDWNYEVLGKLVDSNRGISYGIVQPGHPNSSGVPIIRVNNLKKGSIIIDDIRQVEREIESKYQRTRLCGGEILLSLVGTLGECAIVPSNLVGWNVARAVGVIPVLPDIDTKWIYYCLQTPQIQHYINIWATRTVQATFNLRDVARLPIPLPPLSEQKAIAHILSSFDDKIELNRQMNETLEAMARAIFKSWFVDFDPVSAKRSGRQPAGMDTATADLFPDEFEESSLGLIPKGWRVVKLGDVISIYDAKRIPLSGRERSTRQGKYPYYGAASVMDFIDDYLFDGIYILVGEDGSVIDNNDHPIVQYVWGKFWVNNHAHVLQGSSGISNEHLMLFLKITNIRAYITGAVQLKINQGNLCRIPFIMPSEKLCILFAEKISNLYALFRANQEQYLTLATLRDTLLPKLMSGEIRVKEAEKIINDKL